MRKSMIATAVAMAMAAPGAAMADTTLYGKIHVSYDFWGGDNGALEDGFITYPTGQVEAPASANIPTMTQDYSLSSNSSRIGIKGKEAISENLSLVYQWETGIDFGGNGEGIGDKPRNTFVGFQGSWGTLIAGRHDTPFKGVGRKYDLFGDTIGDARAITRMGNEIVAVDDDSDGLVDFAIVQQDDWDRRTNNTVAYVTPDLSGFHATLAYVSDWDSSLNNDNDAYSVSAGYSLGGFMIDAAYEQHNIDQQMYGLDPDNTTDSSSAYRIGAGYEMGGLKVVGLYQSHSDLNFGDGLDVSLWGVGGAYSLGNSTFKAQYYSRDDFDAPAGLSAADTDASMWVVGYDYRLSQQTHVYATYAAMNTGNYVADSIAANTGHGEAPGFTNVQTLGNQPWDTAIGADSAAFSVGVVHKF